MPPKQERTLDLALWVFGHPIECLARLIKAPHGPPPNAADQRLTAPIARAASACGDNRFSFAGHGCSATEAPGRQYNEACRIHVSFCRLPC